MNSDRKGSTSQNAQSFGRDEVGSLPLQGQRDMSQSMVSGNYPRNQARTLSFVKSGLQDLQSSLKGTLYGANTPSNLLLPQLSFLGEEKFKKSAECWVCKVPFGQLKDRQHHCRLCGNSACQLCSSRTINSQRVCDICFLRGTQLSYEKKRKRFIKAMKEHIEKMNSHLQAGERRIQELDVETVEQRKQLETETKDLGEQYKQLVSVYQRQESEKSELQQQLLLLEASLEPKLQLKQKLSQQEQELDQRLRQIDAQLFLKTQTLEEKKHEYERLKKQQNELESSDSFQNLSLYNEALKQDPTNLSQKLLAISSTQQLNINQSSKATNDQYEFDSFGPVKLKQNQSIASSNSQGRANQLYDSKFIDESQIDQIMNNNENKKHKVREEGKSNQKDQNTKDSSSCQDSGCKVF